MVSQEQGPCPTFSPTLRIWRYPLRESPLKVVADGEIPMSRMFKVKIFKK